MDGWMDGRMGGWISLYYSKSEKSQKKNPYYKNTAKITRTAGKRHLSQKQTYQTDGWTDWRAGGQLVKLSNRQFPVAILPNPCGNSFAIPLKVLQNQADVFVLADRQTDRRRRQK